MLRDYYQYVSLLIVSLVFLETCSTFILSPGDLNTLPQPPRNVKMTSYNFDTKVCWRKPKRIEEEDSSLTFTVLFLDYRNKGKWVTACNHTVSTCCDVSDYVIDYMDSTWARVRSNSKHGSSSYVESKEHITCRDNVISPPTLSVNGSSSTSSISVTIYHPKVVIKGKVETLFYNEDLCDYTFDYETYVTKDEQTITEHRSIATNQDECNSEYCSFTLQQLSQGRYCLYTRGFPNPDVFQYPVDTLPTYQFCVVI